MFGVSSPRRWVLTLLLGLMAISMIGLAGCSKEEVVDPYVYDSLRRITRGDTLSVGFLFEFDAPKFEYVSGNTAIIRDGNLLEFLVGEDLENNYRELSGTVLGVKKSFSPSPTHYVIQRIKRAGVVEQDSLAAPTEYILPKLLREGSIDQETPGAPLPDIGWKKREIDEARSTFLPENEGEDLRPIQTAISRFVYVPRHDLTEEKKLTPEAGDYAWYADFENSCFEMVDIPENTEWMLNLLLEQDLPLIGCFSVVSLEDDYSLRKIEHDGLGHVVGSFQINWFKYASTYVKGTD
jgi:hypothetical protein